MRSSKIRFANLVSNNECINISLSLQSGSTAVLRLRGGAGEDHEQGDFSDQSEREGETIDCKGCGKGFRYGIELFHHLKSERNCFGRHVGEFVDASVEAIVIKEVNCLFCDIEKNKKLKTHLKKEEACRVKYLHFFEINNNEDAMDSIMRKLNSLRRTLCPSRTLAERRKEYKGLNTFLKETALGSSIVLCQKCNSSGTLKQMVVSDHENNEVIQCKRCHLNLPDPAVPEKFFSNSVTEVDFNKILYPGILYGGEESNVLKFSTILLPCSFVDSSELGFPRSPNSTQDHVYKMSRNGGSMDYNNYYPLIYENELNKVGNCKVKGPVVPGYISNIATREICLKETDPSTKRVKGTKDYFEYNQDQMVHSFQQVGAVCLLTEVTVPYYSPAVLATQLKVNRKRRVDIDFSRLPEIFYFVHRSHDADEDCIEECPVTDMEYLREKIRGKEDKVISLVTVANYTQEFFRKFVLKIINDDQSTLGADFYDANLQFPVDCNYTKMVIASWPTALNVINSKIAKKEKFFKEEIDNYISYVDSNLTTTLCPQYLKETFNLSTEVAELVSNLAREHQLRQNIDCCSQLPSQYTMMKFASKFGDNMQVVKMKNAFLSYVEARIVCLKGNDLDSDVKSFLRSIEYEEGFHISKNADIITCVLPGDEEFVFPWEERYSKIMEDFGLTEFQALYHWALTFNQHSTFDLVLRSESLLDSFVEPFHPQYLLAVKSRVKSVFVGDHQDVAVMKLKSGQKELDVEPGHILHKFDMTHHQVSLLEGIFRFDRSKNFSLSNINPLFVAINKERKLKFKRAENLDHENHFLNPADNLWYEIYEDMYDKFLMKPAIYNKLVFFEFLGWFSRVEEAEENLDQNNEQELDPIMALCNDDSNGTNQRLPKSIRLSNNEVFQRRSRRKVISYSLDKKKSLHTELVLFRPHTSREELENIDLNTMTALLNEKDQFPELNGLGEPLTKIQTVKLRSNGFMFDSKFNKCDKNSEFVEIYFDT